jgi:ribonuclease Y
MEIRELLPFLGRGEGTRKDASAPTAHRPPRARATQEPEQEPPPATRAQATKVPEPRPAPATSDETDPGLADELRARRAEIARMEEQALRQAQSIQVQLSELERRRQALDDRERNLEGQLEELKRAKRVQRRELEELSGLSVAQAKQLLVKEVEEEARHHAGLTIQRVESETKRDAERRARNILAVAMQRLAATHASETTTRLVELPNDEMKGRIIGRDGRNIRALENLTGVDLIIDETPSAVVLSSFDGVRREIARLTLEKLIADGRIHPALCEDMYEQAKAEIEARIEEDGERAVLEARVLGLDPELVRLLGQLKYRTSYGQNVLDHLVECSQLAGMMAEELGASVDTARRAALLHDIGKAVTHEVEGSHALVGGKLARRHGEDEAVAHAMEAHHNEVEPRTVEAVLVQAADALSGARPGARGESLEQYVTRLRDLEEIAGRHDGVHKVFAMKAGREIRVMVDPGEVDDERAALISHEIAAAVEKEMDYPGRIKITVIRESRSTSFAS